jgi:hypothetical protein
VDRCALFVDAGYVLADGAMAVHGTRRRESVSWDYGGLLQLLASQAMERSRLPLLRCYWYETTAEGQRSEDHEALADLPGVKLRVAKMWPGRREGSELQRDLTTLARNKAVSDAMVVSAEENLAQVISDVQELGMRVTLLNIAVDGNATVSRTLRQECDDIVEISSAQLRPYVELIPGAEPPRADERDPTLVALRPGTNGNGNGNANGNGNGRGLAGRTTQSQPSARPAPGQQPSTPNYAAPAVSEYAEYPEYPDYQRDPGQQERAESAAAGTVAPEASTSYVTSDYVGGGEYGADFGSTPDYGSAPDYGQPTEYAPAAHDPGTPAPEPVPLRQDQAVLRQDMMPSAQERGAALEAQPGRPDYGVRRGAPRPELAPRAEAPARDEIYAAPVALPAAAEDQGVERQSARLRQETDPLRPVESGYTPGIESGYNPGAVREQYQADAVIREAVAGDGADRYQPVPVPVPVPLPANSAQIRRLPARGPGQPGSAPGQPEPVAGPPSGAQAAVPPPVPIDGRGMGYAGARGGSYGGPRSIGPVPGGAPGSPGSQGSAGTPAVGGPVSFGEQPSNGAAPAGPPIPMSPMVQQPVPAGPGDAGARPQGGPGSGGYQAQNQAQNQAPSPVAAVPAAPVSAAAPAYSGGQSGASLADAVQSAHEEGQAFGDSVARDAPALWLEAVLARKPRMPSDLEARLLQGSALPIDFLLHDEVRHALRRGFWDALERARR